uniref:Histone deacetylase domain-containing protein n=1 Tax=Periophthalmus magnuspinnatus TaxID=409849 RepID=A0A3B4A7M9_9GOBI
IPHHTELYGSTPKTSLPIVYHSDYNITFMGLEKLHPFDAGKWGKVIHFLKEEQFITDENIVEAREASEQDLLVTHTKRYLNRLKGNGHERDFLDDQRVFIMDMYNRHIYPRDAYAKRAIKRRVELDWGTEDSEYLQKVELHCDGALNEVRPDVIVYNAGTDILDGDPLGGLSISPHGIVKRDELVFRAARRRGIPILMVTSGGYQKKTARIIADSILNLHHQGLIGPEREGLSSAATSPTSGPGSSGSALTAI